MNDLFPGRQLNFMYFTTIKEGYKNIPGGALVGCGIDKEHFWSGKTIGISSLDKNPNLLMPAVGFEPTTSNSLRGSDSSRLVYHLYHSATENWRKTKRKTITV